MRSKFTVKNVAVVVAAAAIALSIWLWHRDVRPTMIEGWAEPNGNGTAIWLRSDSSGAGQGAGYNIAGAPWAGIDNVTHFDDGPMPTCVGTDTTSKKHVRIGVVDVDVEGMRWSHVVWLRCLE